jgi:structural maintenance of chromosomes protein 6
MNLTVKTLTNEISSYEKEIRAKAESQGNVQAEREAAQQRLQAAQTQCDAAKEALTRISDEPASLQRRLNQIREQGKQADADIAHARQEIEAAYANIEQCKHQGGNDIKLFGNNLEAVHDVIQKEKWYGEVPVGPFGRFVTVKDPKWAMVMRIQLGQLMSSFAVTDNRDRNKLRQILDHHRKFVRYTGSRCCLIQLSSAFTQIIVSDVDLFDYSRGEFSAPPR